jgi:hypothetical protein
MSYLAFRNFAKAPKNSKTQALIWRLTAHVYHVHIRSYYSLKSAQELYAHTV